MLRVIQWATGSVGKHAVVAVHAHRDLELVGALVYPQRLGVGYEKLEAQARARGENPDLSQLMGRVVRATTRAARW